MAIFGYIVLVLIAIFVTFFCGFLLYYSNAVCESSLGSIIALVAIIIFAWFLVVHFSPFTVVMKG